MQKLINTIALLSGLVSLSIVGGGTYLYLNKDTLIEDAREKVTKTVTDAVTKELPGMISGAMPKMPKVTGPALPEIPRTTGPAIPGF